MSASHASPGPERNHRHRGRAGPVPSGVAQGRRLSFTNVATRVATAVGSARAFLAALVLVVIWGATGPMFHYSETWQLVINTATTIITFLMVFLIQHTQNRDALAVQLKLNELIAAVRGASNELIDVERLSDDELEDLRVRYEGLVQRVRSAQTGRESHSVAEVGEVSSRSG
ncbi:MAG TPA: low affinity iron permease family protein [Methylomirabilota bacterium]|nr:low affinity iron permease family protein [Methylomirabilota bacterium]